MAASSQVEMFQLTKELRIPLFFEIRGLDTPDFDEFPLFCDASIVAFAVTDINWKIVAHRNGASVEYQGALDAQEI